MSLCLVAELLAFGVAKFKTIFTLGGHVFKHNGPLATVVTFHLMLFSADREHHLLPPLGLVV